MLGIKNISLYKNPSNWSSRSEVFCKKGVLRNFSEFTKNHMCQSLSKLQALEIYEIHLKTPVPEYLFK